MDSFVDASAGLVKGNIRSHVLQQGQFTKTRKGARAPPSTSSGFAVRISSTLKRWAIFNNPSGMKISKSWWHWTTSALLHVLALVRRFLLLQGA
jgi:hypothetical protein